MCTTFTCNVVVTMSYSVLRSLGEWHTLVGEGGGSPLRVTYERDSGMDVTSPKHGKVGTQVQYHQNHYCAPYVYNTYVTCELCV